MTTVITLFLGITAFFSLLVFVLKGLGLFKLAKLENLKKPILAFIPVANNYVLGSLAENKEKPSNLKKLLLILNIIAIITVAVFLVSSGFAISSVFESAKLAIETDVELTLSELKPFILVLVTFVLAVAAVAIYKVFYYISLWRVYNKQDKSKALMAIILSVIFAFLVPVFLLVLKKQESYSENGLPQEAE